MDPTGPIAGLGIFLALTIISVIAYWYYIRKNPSDNGDTKTRGTPKAKTPKANTPKASTPIAEHPGLLRPPSSSGITHPSSPEAPPADPSPADPSPQADPTKSPLYEKLKPLQLEDDFTLEMDVRRDLAISDLHGDWKKEYTGADVCEKGGYMIIQNTAAGKKYAYCAKNISDVPGLEADYGGPPWYRAGGGWVGEIWLGGKTCPSGKYASITKRPKGGWFLWCV